MANTLEILNFVNTSFAMNPPSFVGYQSTTQTLTNAAWTSLSLDSSSYDNYVGHSNSTNNSRYTAQIAGWYTCCGVYAPQAGNSSGFRAVRLATNGTSTVLGGASYSGQPTTAEDSPVTPTKDVFLNVGDYVEVQGWQNTGGNYNTAINSDLRSGLWVRFSHF
jgi:hypothetical protein